MAGGREQLPRFAARPVRDAGTAPSLAEKKIAWALPGSPLLFFLYKYFFRLGFLDGVPGLIYCGFQGIQFFHIKAKIYELRMQREQ